MVLFGASKFAPGKYKDGTLRGSFAAILPQCQRLSFGQFGVMVSSVPVI